MSADILPFRRPPPRARNPSFELAGATLGLAASMTAAWLGGWVVAARIVAAAMEEALQ